MALEDIGYVFLSSNSTQKECFERKLFGHSKKNLGIVEQIRDGDYVFLFNTDSKILIGPFDAVGNGQYDIEPDAWTSKFAFGFPAQVRVAWKELHVVKNALYIFPFLNIYYRYQLTTEETRNLLEELKRSPIFTPSDSEKENVDIESQAERKFAELLDNAEISYIKCSQTRSDFSRVLKDMKAKRPDFLVFKEKPYLVEVKPWLIHFDKQYVNISSLEIEKLKQLELATGVGVSIAFPIDPLGLEWRAINPGWAWAKGQKKRINKEEFLSIPIKEIENNRLAFL